MKGTFRLLTIAKIPVYIHWSFGLVFFYLWYEGERSALNWIELCWLAFFILTIFVCVVLHEFGHALTARYYGVETKDIILSPIGGIARLSRLPEKPLQEFFVALAGPLVNFGIAILLSVYFLFFPFSDLQLLIVQKDPRAFVPVLVGLNVLLGGFNLLPAFPLDGGRIFRALLSIRLGRIRATKFAVIIGQLIAVACFYVAYVRSDFVLAFFGLFVIYMATHEYRNVKLTAILAEGKISEIMHAPIKELRKSQQLDLVFDYFKRGLGRNFLIFDDEEDTVIGVLPEASIIKAMKQSGWENHRIAGLMTPHFDQAQVNDSLREVFLEMYEPDKELVVAIYDEEEVVGLLDLDMIYHYLEIRKKLT
ncbi:MAG: site-2 protease family protein [Bacteroidota bacterium]